MKKDMKLLNKFSKKILAGVLLTLMLVSCSDEFLNPTPATSISVEEVFESYTTAQAALIGVYDQLSSSSFEGLYSPMLGDIIGEDVLINSTQNYNWFVPVYQMDLQSNSSYAAGIWNAGYKVMHDANRIIEGAIDLPVAEDNRNELLVAEAKTIRAFVMLKLVQMYAPAYSVDPMASGILLANRVIGAEEDDIGRATVGEAYTQIVNDLISALTELEEGDNPGFFDKSSAHAILARTYMDMEEWQLAKDNAVLAYSTKSLAPSERLIQGFYEVDEETIFSLAYTVDDNNTYLTIPSFYWPVSGYSSMRASKAFSDLFSASDIRQFQFFIQESIDPDNTLILKFQHNQQIGDAERIVIRAAEMYLIEAECEAELGNYPEAQEALYKIQSRADGGVQRSSAIAQALIDEILVERRKELFGEGFRWNDIKRRSARFVRASDHWITFDFGFADDDYYRMLLPIPQGEINANNVLTQADQNPGY